MDGILKSLGKISDGHVIGCCIVLIFIIIWMYRTRLFNYNRRYGGGRSSEYKRTAAAIKQSMLENQYYYNLRSSNKNSRPEFMGSDELNVYATDAEPTKSMLIRSYTSVEGPMDEGTFTPWSSLESGMMKASAAMGRGISKCHHMGKK